ncbi:Sensor histidine kinase QseE [Serratia fonticola]|uniref:histidine kinase n=1 Tax=Serratia fonticola TaxID=47917 RepID=A0A4U9WCI9_SERFO|nr:Sensor histidine kinase QseE [Serratia fonticola]
MNCVLLAQRIVWLSERLAWLESQRHEFLRHISHELKTPLASMREGTELLADGVAGPLTSDQEKRWWRSSTRAAVICNC